MFIGHFGWGGVSTRLLTLSPLNQVPPPSGYAVLEDRGSSPSLCPLSPACVRNLSLCPLSPAHKPCSRPPRGHRGDRCPCPQPSRATPLSALDDDRTPGYRPSLLPHVPPPPPRLHRFSSLLRPNSPRAAGLRQCCTACKSRRSNRTFLTLPSYCPQEP